MILHEEGRSEITTQNIMKTTFLIEERDETNANDDQKGLAKANKYKRVNENIEESNMNKNCDNDNVEQKEKKSSKVSELITENQNLKERSVCKICRDRSVGVVFLPCGHLVSCLECCKAIKECPICRAVIKGNAKAFI